jgi:hypothetical protein
MSPRYSNFSTVGVFNTPIAPVSMSVATDCPTVANTCDCEALRTAVILFSGLNAGMLAIGLVWVMFRRSKWIKKGAETKEAEHERLKGMQKERKGLLLRSVASTSTYLWPLLIQSAGWPMLFRAW